MSSGWSAVQFDNRTAVQVGSLAAFSISLLSALLWRTRRTYPGFARWMLGNCCAGLSLAALALRGVVPDWESVVLTNAMAFGSVVLLLEGNRRFTTGRRLHPHQDADRRESAAAGQRPFAVLFGCSDSRLAAEIIFDRGIGDLFVVRTAGHVI